MAVVVVAVSLWFGLSRRTGEANYTQAPMTLRCGACGYTQTVSIDKYTAMINKEKPNGRDLVEGPELTCPKCKKMKVLPVQSEEEKPAR